MYTVFITSIFHTYTFYSIIMLYVLVKDYLVTIRVLLKVTDIHVNFTLHTSVEHTLFYNKLHAASDVIMWFDLSYYMYIL